MRIDRVRDRAGASAKRSGQALIGHKRVYMQAYARIPSR